MKKWISLLLGLLMTLSLASCAGKTETAGRAAEETEQTAAAEPAEPADKTFWKDG